MRFFVVVFSAEHEGTAVTVPDDRGGQALHCSSVRLTLGHTECDESYAVPLAHGWLSDNGTGRPGQA